MGQIYLDFFPKCFANISTQKFKTILSPPEVKKSLKYIKNVGGNSSSMTNFYIVFSKISILRKSNSLNPQLGSVYTLISTYVESFTWIYWNTYPQSLLEDLKYDFILHKCDWVA